MTDSVTDPNLNRDEHDDTGSVKAKRVKGYVWNPNTLVWDKMTQPSSGSEAAYTTRIDAADSTTTYLGSADPGTSESDPLWQVKKIDSNNPTNIKFADGNSNFDNIWANRASLTYS